MKFWFVMLTLQANSWTLIQNLFLNVVFAVLVSGQKTEVRELSSIEMIVIIIITLSNHKCNSH